MRGIALTPIEIERTRTAASKPALQIELFDRASFLVSNASPFLLWVVEIEDVKVRNLRKSEPGGQEKVHRFVEGWFTSPLCMR